MTRLKDFLVQFRDDTSGVIAVQAVMTVPILFWSLAASYEFFEIHRFKSVREKATYTIADIVSRETSNEGVTNIYMDNALKLFGMISNDDGQEEIRVSVIKYDSNADRYSISWSKVRGTGDLLELTDADVAQAHSELPIMDDGESLILVESTSQYHPLFNVGITNNTKINTRVFTSIRFAPQVCFESVCG